MAEVVDLIDKIKRYYRFTPSEIKGLAVAIVAIAFIVSFTEWGTSGVDFAAGLFNFFNAILIVALAFFVHISVQRIWGLIVGLRVEWKMWGLGLLIGLIMAFLSNGYIWMILPGGIIVHHMAGHRLGWFRYDLNWWTLTVVAAAGPIASMLLAIMFKAMGAGISTGLIQKAMVFNIAYALYSIIPIPPLDGSRIIFGSRLFYVFSSAGLVAVAILLSLDISIWLSILASFLVGLLVWLLYYIFFESKVWVGG